MPLSTSVSECKQLLQSNFTAAGFTVIKTPLTLHIMQYQQACLSLASGILDSSPRFLFTSPPFYSHVCSLGETEANLVPHRASFSKKV